jgi:hypothetical protein
MNGQVQNMKTSFFFAHGGSHGRRCARRHAHAQRGNRGKGIAGLTKRGGTPAKMIGSSTCGSGGQAALSGGNQRISPRLGARTTSTGGATHITDEGEGTLGHGEAKSKKNGRRMEFTDGTADWKNRAR